MNINVKTISLCFGLASFALGQTTTAPIYTASIYGGQPTYSLGDGGPANTAVVSAPQGVAVDSAGNIYISDNSNGKIRRIDAGTGNISTFASVSGANGLAIGTDSSTGKTWLFVASGGSHIINRYDLATDTKGGTVQASAVLIAGESGNGRCCGDGYHAVDAVLNAPGGVAVDSAGNVYIADTSNNRVRWVPNTNNCVYSNPNTCNIYTLAGPGPSTGNGATSAGAPVFGVSGQSNVGTNTVGDGGLAIQARVSGPYGIAVSPDGTDVYFSETGDQRIRDIDMTMGKISTLVGACLNTSTSSSATSQQSTNPTSIPTSNASGRSLVIPCPSGSFGNSTTNNTTAATSTLYDGQVGTSATVNSPRGLFLDSVHNKLYFADSSNNRIRAVDLGTGIVTTVVGSGSNSKSTTTSTININGTTVANVATSPNDGTALLNLNIDTPYAVWLSSGGNLYFTEQAVNRIRVVDPVQNVTSSLTGQPRSTGSGGPATAALLGIPTAFNTGTAPRVAVDPAGNVYVVETAVNKIRKITPDGTISDWAGSGQTTQTSGNPTTGIPIDGGPATAARLSSPGCVTFDAQGNGYIADSGDGTGLIRKVDTNGNISTVAGRFKVKSSSNPTTGCAPAPQAQGLCAVDPSSNYLGDGGLAVNAILNNPKCVASDAAGNLYIADTGNNAIRMVNAGTGVIDTIAGGQSAHIAGGPTDGRSGTGPTGATGDGANALYALFDTPLGIAVDGSGNVFFTAYNNMAVRKLTPNLKGGYTITTIWGQISSSNNDGITIPTGTGAPTNPLRGRYGSQGMVSVATDAAGNIYLCDQGNSKVEIIDAALTKLYQIAGGGSADTGLDYTSGNGFNIQSPSVTGVAVDSNYNVYFVDRLGAVTKLAAPKTGFPAHGK